jgi:hypothetical protein
MSHVLLGAALPGLLSQRCFEEVVLEVDLSFRPREEVLVNLSPCVGVPLPHDSVELRPLVEHGSPEDYPVQSFTLVYM